MPHGLRQYKFGDIARFESVTSVFLVYSVGMPLGPYSQENGVIDGELGGCLGGLAAVDVDVVGIGP